MQGFSKNILPATWWCRHTHGDLRVLRLAQGPAGAYKRPQLLTEGTLSTGFTREVYRDAPYTTSLLILTLTHCHTHTGAAHAANVRTSWFQTEYTQGRSPLESGKTILSFVLTCPHTWCHTWHRSSQGGAQNSWSWLRVISQGVENCQTRRSGNRAHTLVTCTRVLITSKGRKGRRRSRETL